MMWSSRLPSGVYTARGSQIHDDKQTINCGTVAHNDQQTPLCYESSSHSRQVHHTDDVEGQLAMPLNAVPGRILATQRRSVVILEPRSNDVSYSQHSALACGVLLIFNPLFGIVSFFLAGQYFIRDIPSYSSSIYN